MKTQLSKLNQMMLFFLVPFLMGTAIDLYVPSLPFIAQYFHSPDTLSQLTISLYMLGYGVGQLFLGIISDKTGRKKILILGSIIFIISSVLAANAISIYMLITCRFLQGVGMAGMGVMCRIIAVDCYADTQLVKKYTYYSCAWALGPVLGPFIGSYLQHYFNWQANFYFFTIFSLLILLVAIFNLPETIVAKQNLQIKAIGQRIKSILAHKGFLLSACIATLTYSGLILFNVVGPFIIQKTLHYSVLSYGHIALLLGLGVCVGTLLNRIAVNYFSPMKIFSLGLGLLLIVGLISIVLAYIFVINIYFVVAPVVLFLLVCGLILPNMVSKTVSFFPHLAGTTGAVYGLISAGGIFIITSVASLLPVTNQIPLFFFYFTIFIISSILFVVFIKKYAS